MSSDDKLISVQNLGKAYHIYERPIDRLKQTFFGGKSRQYYKEFNALQDVTFDVYKGCSLGVIGNNGAGKSTLLQLITGTLEPTSGSVTIQGKVAAILELGAGFNPEFSGRENIELYCNLFHMSSETIKQRFAPIVEFSELEEFIEQPLKTYSSGMVARLAFSVISHVDADILIIDEALSVGDAAFSQKCMRFLHQFKQNGTIFFVSHDISAVKTFCDDAIWLEHGNVRDFGEASKVCDAYLADVYPNASDSSTEAQEEREQIKQTLSISELKESLLEETQQKAKASVVAGSQKLEAFKFDTNASHFGNGDAEILSVTLLDNEDNNLAICDGRTRVTVKIKFVVFKDIVSPIVGFFVKDRLGQPLFGGNTYLTYENHPVTVKKGEIAEANFTFQFPILLVGDYSITAAIAEGSLDSHSQLHWVHDAALFKVTESTQDGVLVGIPIDDIEMKISN